MIQNSAAILDEFSRYFNARLDTVNFVFHAENLKIFLNGENPLNEDCFMTMRFENNPSAFDQLIAFGYPELLYEIIKRLKIENEMLDIFRTQMSDEYIQAYNMCLKEMASMTLILIDTTNRIIKIQCMEFFIGLFWPPLSQFHTTVCSELQRLNNLITMESESASFRKNSDAPMLRPKFYLESKASTPFFFFITAFIAENLKIPINHEDIVGN